MHISKWLLRSSNVLQTIHILDYSKKKSKSGRKNSNLKFAARTVLLEVCIVVGILKTNYLKLAILF